MKKLIFVLLAAVSFCSCDKTDKKTLSIVPYPNRIELQSGTYDLKGQPFVCDERADERTQRIVKELAAQLSKISMQESAVRFEQEMPSEGVRFVVDTNIASENYKLVVDAQGVELRASDFNGFLYGVQTLKQMMPVAIFGQTPAQSENWGVQYARIEDAPRFGYRGMHLDVSRHFFSLDEVKRYLDVMAMHKLNVFHWHLTDDQGWRIEIKRYPKLTSVGSKRKGTVVQKNWNQYDNIPYGGYYTQDDVREIVQYAHDLGITVVPEIDLPGHMLAALTAYPELGCTGGPYEVWGRWGVSDDVLCVGKELSFEFLENVLTEVMELFPSKYIHIGGDECPKVRWTTCPRCQARIKALGLKADEKHSVEHFLQSYVTERIGKFLAQHGRRAIGWDEILEGKAPADAVIMSWRGSDGGIAAAKLGHDVIMTPNSHFYFDYYQTLDIDDEPFAIGGYLPVKQCYSYDPAFPELTKEEQAHILGVQANLWTEYVVSDAQLEYMLLPRMAALSEVQWTQPENKSWERFIGDFRLHKIYDAMGYNYAKHVFGVSTAYEVDFEKGAVMMTLSTQGDAPIHYTMDGTEPTAQSPRYTAPVAIDHTATFKAAALREGIDTPIYSRSFNFTKATARKATLNSQPTTKYTYGGLGALLDGYRGGVGYTNGAWVGFMEEPMDVTIDMGGQTYSSVLVEALVEKGEWVFPPHSIEILTSEDGTNFQEIVRLACPEETAKSDDGVKQFKVGFDETSARYLRVVAHTVNPIPEWHGARGHKSHMFIDEIVVE